MLNRAIACFKAQTYERKRLFIFDTGSLEAPVMQGDGIYAEYFPLPLTDGVNKVSSSVGALRNMAINYGQSLDADIIVHWDDDDWNHPQRIAEQVALLQASGKEAVGYREMLFWDTRRQKGSMEVVPSQPQAWLYSSGNPRHCLGTSLCYWRRVWERRPFEDVQTGEDYAWLKGVDSVGVTGLQSPMAPDGSPNHAAWMIASIHGGNTSPAYKYLEACEAQGEKWKRVSEWDEYCRKVMSL